MGLQNLTDEELLREVEDPYQKYSSEYIDNIRLELMFRNYRQINGIWSKANKDELLWEMREELRLLKTEITKLKSPPHTQLINSGFWNRAFAVWGHYIAAQLVIAGSLFTIVFIIEKMGT